MSNTIIGKVEKLPPTQELQSKSGTPFYKRELVLDASRYDSFTGEKRENHPLIEFSGARCAELDNIKVGDMVEVSFVLDGFKYEKDGETRYFTKVTGYRVEQKGTSKSRQKPLEQADGSAIPPFEEAPVYEDRLPF